jgi:hypothetical protein
VRGALHTCPRHKHWKPFLQNKILSLFLRCEWSNENRKLQFSVNDLCPWMEGHREVTRFSGQSPGKLSREYDIEKPALQVWV